MMTKLVIVAAVMALLVCVAPSARAADNTCHGHLTCADCVGSQFCGWCSEKVSYVNGTVGAHCISSQINGWDCNGQYSTEKCLPGYACNTTTHQCYETPPGTGTNKAACEMECKPTTIAPTMTPAPPAPPTPTMPPSNYTCNTDTYQCTPSMAANATSEMSCIETCIAPVYKCNNVTFACSPVPPGTPGATSLPVCEQECQPNNGSVPALVGYWRALEIDNSYVSGEFGFNFTESGGVVVYDPSGAVVTGYVQTFDGELWITFTSGAMSGKTIKGYYEIETQEPETASAFLGFGMPGAPCPNSIEYAMIGGGNTFFVAWKCLEGVDCSFHAPTTSARPNGASKTLDALALLAKYDTAPGDNDPCNAWTTCGVCLSHDLCGWCTSDLIYGNVTTDFQCGGFFENGTAKGFICNGQYKKSSCDDYICDETTHSCIHSNTSSGGSLETCEQTCKPPPQLYTCNQTTFTCEATNSSGIPLTTCDAQCMYVPPSNSTPAALIGNWRGLQIQNGYTVGEFDVVINNTTMTLYGPDGSSSEAKVETEGATVLFVFSSGPDAGKTLKAMYQTAPNDPVNFLALAAGAPDGPVPSSFEAAMTGAGETEYVLVSCSAPDCTFKMPSLAGDDATAKTAAAATLRERDDVVRTRIIG